MARKQEGPEDQPDATRAPADELRVAYHSGPDEIRFFGRPWQRGKPQPVSYEHWEAMHARGDFHAFEFRIVE